MVINDNFDLALMGDIYTNGSFGFRAENTYAVRYKFRGNLSFRFESLISSEKGFPDYSKSKIYNLSGLIHKMVNLTRFTFFCLC